MEIRQIIREFKATQTEQLEVASEKIAKANRQALLQQPGYREALKDEERARAAIRKAEQVRRKFEAKTPTRAWDVKRELQKKLNLFINQVNIDAWCATPEQRKKIAQKIKAFKLVS